MITNYMRDHTFVVTFASPSNGLEAKVECISVSRYAAASFVRRQHNFKKWQFVSVEKKYD